MLTQLCSALEEVLAPNFSGTGVMGASVWWRFSVLAQDESVLLWLGVGSH